MLRACSVVTGLLIFNRVHGLPRANVARPMFRRAMTAGMLTRSPVHILALDFDGVICASADESSRTAMLAANNLWPGSIPEINSFAFSQICAALTALRPVVETGYEIVILSRLLSDMPDWTETANTSVRHIEALGEVRTLWSPQFRDNLLLQYGTSKESLVKAFGSTRDRLILKNPDQWTDLNRFYPAVDCALAGIVSSDKLCIITTKQERFVRRLLEHNNLSHLIRGECGGNTATGVVNEHGAFSSNIFDLHNRYGSKAEVLRELARRDSRNEVTINFVEDRYETLLSVLAQRQAFQLEQTPSGLENVRLYLAEWGYNTAEQRAKARLKPDISVINQTQFAALVKATSI